MCFYNLSSFASGRFFSVHSKESVLNDYQKIHTGHKQNTAYYSMSLSEIFFVNAFIYIIIILLYIWNFYYLQFIICNYKINWIN